MLKSALLVSTVLPFALASMTGFAAAQSTGKSVSKASASGEPARAANAPAALEKAPVGKRQWPKTMADARREAAEKAAPAQWTSSEIAEAKAQCAAELKGLHVIAIPVEPIREGECGSPAPLRLVSIGKAPQVTFNPPPIVTCALVRGLATWLDTSIQPMAKRHLGKRVVQVDVMSDYSCRRAYGRKNSRLSEHGRANALDIRGFVTASGATSTLASDWGPTARAVRAQVAAAEQARAKAEAHRKALAAKADKAATAVADAAAKPRASSPATRGSPPAPATTLVGTVTDDCTDSGVAGVGRMLSRSLMPQSTSQTRLGLSRLGGPVPPRAAFGAPETSVRSDEGAVTPLGYAAEATLSTVAGRAKAARASTPVAPTPIGRQQFIRAIHVSACTIFGTTLGPEANKAHEDHFHVDMAERRNGMKYCE